MPAKPQGVHPRGSDPHVSSKVADARGLHAGLLGLASGQSPCAIGSDHVMLRLASHVVPAPEGSLRLWMKAGEHGDGKTEPA